MVLEGEFMVAVTAFTLGALSVAGLRLIALSESRASRGPSPQPHGPRVRVRGLAARVRAAPAGETADVPRKACVGAKFQVNEFVRSLVVGGCCDKWRDRAILAAYRAWAREWSIVALPDSVLLATLAKHTNVRRSRERLKDITTGRVVKLPSGSPVRGSFYTINARPITDVPPGVALHPQAPIRHRARETGSRPGVQGRPARVHRRPERIAA